MKAACVAARGERDQTRSERDQKMAELQLLRGQLHDLAVTASGGDSALNICSRTIQVALMEILDGVGDEEEEQESSNEEAGGSNNVTHGGGGAGS